MVDPAGVFAGLRGGVRSRLGGVRLGPRPRVRSKQPELAGHLGKRLEFITLLGGVGWRVWNEMEAHHGGDGYDVFQVYEQHVQDGGWVVLAVDRTWTRLV